MKWNSYKFSDELVVCDDVDDFIAQLTSKFAPGRYVFRGHSNLAYKLKPSAHRSKKEDINSYNAITKYADLGKINTELDLHFAEARSISKFVYQCNRSGLSLPYIKDRELERQLSAGRIENIVYKVPNTIQHSENDYYQWPPEDLIPILGLMQHYGLPTRLLDWSWSPLVAAYFAASGVRSFKDGDEKICIWAMEIDQMLDHSSIDPAREDSDKAAMIGHMRFPYRILNPRSNFNANMLRQQGLFTVRLSEQSYAMTPGRGSAKHLERTGEDYLSGIPEFHDQILQLFESGTLSKFPIGHDGSANPRIFALFLKHNQCGGLMERLYSLGYSGDRLFDGFEGVVKGMNEYL